MQYAHARHPRNLTQSCAISMHLLQMGARVSYSVHLTRFLVNNFAEFPDVRVKIIEISSGHWWYFELATSAIGWTCLLWCCKTVACQQWHQHTAKVLMNSQRSLTNLIPLPSPPLPSPPLPFPLPIPSWPIETYSPCRHWLWYSSAWLK